MLEILCWNQRMIDPVKLAQAEAERDAWFAALRKPLKPIRSVSLQQADPQDSAKKHSTDRLNVEILPPIVNHMVEYQLSTTFHALSDSTRRGMLANLAQGEKSISDLARPFDISFAGASKHVRVLEDAGLVARRKVGRSYMCALQPKPLAEANKWLRQWEAFWNVRLDRLEALIAAEKEKSE